MSRNSSSGVDEPTPIYFSCNGGGGGVGASSHSEQRGVVDLEEAQEADGEREGEGKGEEEAAGNCYDEEMDASLYDFTEQAVCVASPPEGIDVAVLAAEDERDFFSASGGVSAGEAAGDEGGGDLGPTGGKMGKSPPPPYPSPIFIICYLFADCTAEM